MVLWIVRLCIPLLLSWDFGFDRDAYGDVFLDLRVSSTFSLRGTSSGTCTPTLRAVLSQHFVTLGYFVNSCLLLVMLLFHGFLGPNPWLLFNGFSDPNPWLLYLLHGHLARVSSNQIQ